MGNRMTMHFCYAGTVSDEESDIVSDDGTEVLLANGFRFEKATGRCLNDETWGGASRTIDPDPEAARRAVDGKEREFLSAYPTPEDYYDALCDAAADEGVSCPGWEAAEAGWAARTWPY